MTVFNPVPVPVSVPDSAPPPPATTPSLLDIHDLVVGFPSANGWRRVVDRVSLRVDPGERVGLVGGSGSGKSLTALAAVGLVPNPGKPLAGTVRVAGVDLATASPSQLRRVRGGEIGLVFQEPSSALNPVWSVGFQLVETIRSHHRASRSLARTEALRLLAEVRVDQPQAILPAYPHQLSGGQAQRVMLALALAGSPRLLVADEPTTALDLTTQAEVLALLRRTCEEQRLALLLIGHDLAVVSSLVSRILVMLAGEVVEEASTADLFARPLHPYSRLLLASVAGRRDRNPEASHRHLPPLGPDLPGCRFAPACPIARPACSERHPELDPVAPARTLRCPVVAEQVSG